MIILQMWGLSKESQSSSGRGRRQAGCWLCEVHCSLLWGQLAPQRVPEAPTLTWLRCISLQHHPFGAGLAGSSPKKSRWHQLTGVHLGDDRAPCMCHGRVASWGPSGQGAGWWPLMALEVASLYWSLGSSKDKPQASLGRVLSEK